MSDCLFSVAIADCLKLHLIAHRVVLWHNYSHLPSTCSPLDSCACVSIVLGLCPFYVYRMDNLVRGTQTYHWREVLYFCGDDEGARGHRSPDLSPGLGSKQRLRHIHGGAISDYHHNTRQRHGTATIVDRGIANQASASVSCKSAIGRTGHSTRPLDLICTSKAETPACQRPLHQVEDSQTRILVT